jgi:hypothetical protein
MSPNASRLAMITKDLLIQWQQTRESWADGKSLEFERKYLEELKAGVDNAVTIIEQLENLLTKIRKDCE